MVDGYRGIGLPALGGAHGPDDVNKLSLTGSSTVSIFCVKPRKERYVTFWMTAPFRGGVALPFERHFCIIDFQKKLC